jgi:hypothetical protein
MEDIVAVRVDLDGEEHRFFLTWGRIQDTIDPQPLEQLILDRCPSFALGGKPIQASLCGTLQEARAAPYFYEYFFMMGQQTIPFGRKYKKWKQRMDKKMRSGKELYYLGNPHQSAETNNTEQA